MIARGIYYHWPSPWTTSSWRNFRDGVNFRLKRILHGKTTVSGKKKTIKYKFIDKVRVTATGGTGGSGCVSLEGESPAHRKPSGGSGGSGGNVYVVADQGTESLNFPLHHYNAQDGGQGGGGGKKGRRGKDRYVRVPCGTLVSEVLQRRDFDEVPYAWMLNGGVDDPEGGVATEWGWEDQEEEERGGGHLGGQGTGNKGDIEGQENGEERNTGEMVKRKLEGGEVESEREEEGEGEEEEGGEGDEEHPAEGRGALNATPLADLAQDGDKLLLAQGGKPGLGNIHMPSRRVGGKQRGQRGETRHYTFELRSIADVGLVGYPNAGKSTLLGCITNAKPKVAVYPFTTLSPMVGQVEYSDTVRLRVADIPGLVEGAHVNRGLGHEFLRHVVRTKVLALVVDAAGSEGRVPADDLRSLQEELRLYDESLAGRAAFVAANKIDLPGARQNLESLRAVAGPLPIIPLSALEKDGLLEVVVKMRELVEEALQEEGEEKHQSPHHHNGKIL